MMLNNIWLLLSGLAFFLYGMKQMEESLKNLAGRSFKKFLRKNTKHPIQGVIAGAIITAILQSSSMVSLLVMSFAGAGIIGLENGFGMIMGANLGTTITGWIVSMIGFKLKFENIIFPLTAISGILYSFSKNERVSNISKIFFGFSLMFLGLSFMKNSFSEVAGTFDLNYLKRQPFIIYLLFGIFLSAIIQSSSASMMIFITSLSAGIITLNHAAYLVIGADIGTTFTALIGSIGGSSVKKQVGLSHFFFNFITAIFAAFLVKYYLLFITNVLNIKDELIAIVLYHSLFNVTGIIIFTPIVKPFTRFIKKITPEKEKTFSKYISKVNTQDKQESLEAILKESILFLHQTIQLNRFFFEKDNISRGEGLKKYYNLKKYEGEVSNFYLKLQKENLLEEESSKLNFLIAVFRNATLSVKDIKDISHNLDELEKSGNDNKYKLYNLIQNEQLKLYKSITEYIDNYQTIRLSDIEGISKQIEQSHFNENRIMHNTELSLSNELPTLFNIVREINNSNESLLRSLRYLVQAINGKLKTEETINEY
ncbi:MAG: Na/Pi symporter [Flavobacteriales bacterium]|nr:Na/Pi symporter [Flavobacteriales bacterium]